MNTTDPQSEALEEEVWVISCPYDPPHTHEFPHDWIWSGPDGLDPRGDPRWQPTTYTYYDDQIRVVHMTQVPLCDDQAIDEFTHVANFGPGYRPKWLYAKRPDGTVEPLPVTYDVDTDEVFENDGPSDST